MSTLEEVKAASERFATFLVKVQGASGKDSNSSSSEPSDSFSDEQKLSNAHDTHLQGQASPVILFLCFPDRLYDMAYTATVDACIPKKFSFFWAFQTCGLSWSIAQAQ